MVLMVDQLLHKVLKASKSHLQDIRDHLHLYIFFSNLVLLSQIAFDAGFFSKNTGFSSNNAGFFSINTFTWDTSSNVPEGQATYGARPPRSDDLETPFLAWLRKPANDEDK